MVKLKFPNKILNHVFFILYLQYIGAKCYPAVVSYLIFNELLQLYQ